MKPSLSIQSGCVSVLDLVFVVKPNLFVLKLKQGVCCYVLNV